MKKLLAVLLVLITAATANAGFIIIAGSTTVPVDGTTWVGITTDSTTGGSLIMGLTEDSPASLTPPLGDPIIDEPDPDLADLLGIKDPIFITFPDVPNPPPPPYIIIDDITFQCTGLGDAIIWLFDGEGNFLDSQTIHQTPEPATLALLGLGALLLRRKSKI